MCILWHICGFVARAIVGNHWLYHGSHGEQGQETETLSLCSMISAQDPLLFQGDI